MTFARMGGLLTVLRNTFGEPALWTPPEATAPIEIIGRFRTDPVELPLGEPDGVNTTQTWFFCDRADVPAGGLLPVMGDTLSIRDECWEIVQIDEDDIGELAWRLLRTNEDRPGAVVSRGPGRPSRRADIEGAWAELAGQIDPATPLTRVSPVVRRAITGSDTPAKGLTDKTITRTLRDIRGRPKL